MRVLPRTSWPPLAAALVVLLPMAALMVDGRSGRTASAGPVYREGSRLMVDGQQYKFAGLNADTWFGCWTAEKEATTDENLDRYFRELSPRSMTRIRHYPGRTDLDLMRRIEAAAARYGQYLMVTLTDGGTSCGDGQVNYGDPAPVLSHVRTVVPPLASSRAIAVWEVCNDCSVDPGQTKAWYRVVTDEIKRLAPDTLVAIGGTTCMSLEDCIDTNDLPNNDLISIHAASTSPWVEVTAEIARRLDRPAFVAETGVTNQGVNCGAHDCNADRMVQEFDSYLARPEFAGVFWWDFKWTRNDVATVNLSNPYWPRLAAYRHPWNGGPTPPAPPAGLLSQSKPATASSLEDSGFPASAAVDGNGATRWASQFSSPQWLRVDLGATYAVSRVVLKWETAFANHYQIETSDDGNAWAPVHNSITGDGGVDDVVVSGTGRYVRILCNAPGTEFAYSLWEFQVYGPTTPLLTVNDNASQFEYSAGWQYDSGSTGKYQGDDHYSSSVNAQVLFRFTGRLVKVYAARAPHHGIAAVSIDGGPETSIDQYAATRSDQVLLFTSATLPTGPHTLKLRVTGTQNSASSGTVISVDKAQVTP